MGAVNKPTKQKVKRNSGVPTSKWATFFDRAKVWKAFLIAAVYSAIYLLIGLINSKTFAKDITEETLFNSPYNVFFGVAFAIAIGSFVLYLFGKSTGWWKIIWQKQPVEGKKWMWIAPIAVVLAIVMRFIAADYSEFSAGVLITIMVAGVFIGFAEELLTRGYVVKMLRDAGKSEWTVAVLSSVVFGLLHSTNILSGHELSTVLLTIGFTFGFGMTMYLSMRATGNLIWALILHGLYDPSLMIFTGGIDKVGASSDLSGFAAFVALGNIYVVLVGYIAVLFIRGRVKQPDKQKLPKQVA